eukprot:GHVN01057677.1.p2 GENE.GHVN01057677.1~~GHVN01057677.1.p2  ORF type:complete len:388 (+),score=60.56 GHVN01057677.1:1447-2610(+)
MLFARVGHRLPSLRTAYRTINFGVAVEQKRCYRCMSDNMNLPKITSSNPAAAFQPVPCIKYNTAGEKGVVECSTETEVKTKLSDAASGVLKGDWSNMGVGGRIKALRPIMREFVKRADDFAEMITLETGKTISDSRDEMKRYITYTDWLFEHGETILKDEVVFEDDASLHWVRYEPWGVVATISPWNFPFGMAIFGIIPPLVAGNCVVFKISEECPLTGKLIEEVMHSTGTLPKGVFNEVYGDFRVGEMLTQSEEVNHIWFTGSSQTGKKIYSVAAARMIRATLEMGGSSPCVVFDDIDGDKKSIGISEAAELIVSGRMRHNGQVCTAIKRCIVHERIFQPLVDEICLRMERYTVGDPHDPSTAVGSLVNQSQLMKLEDQLTVGKTM